MYLLQLLVNVLWPVFFFRLEWRLFSFFWLLLLIALVTLTMTGFKYIRPAAYYLMLPYLLWCLFCRISQSRILSAQPLTIPRSVRLYIRDTPVSRRLTVYNPGCFIRPGAFFIKFWGIRIPCIGPGVHFQVGFSRKSRPTALKFGRASYVDLPSGFLRNCVPYGGAAQKHHHTDQTVKYAAIFSTRQKAPGFPNKENGRRGLARTIRYDD